MGRIATQPADRPRQFASFRSSTGWLAAHKEQLFPVYKLAVVRPALLWHPLNKVRSRECGPASPEPGPPRRLQEGSVTNMKWNGLAGLVPIACILLGIFVGGLVFGLADLSTTIGGLFGLVGGYLLSKKVSRRLWPQRE